MSIDSDGYICYFMSADPDLPAGEHDNSAINSVLLVPGNRSDDGPFGGHPGDRSWKVPDARSAGNVARM